MSEKYLKETFTRNSPDKLSGLGIGKITKIKEWLEEFQITSYTINDDFSIDCNDTVMIGHKNLKYLPEFIQFRNILGNFWIEQIGLRSLRGCPIYIEGDFDCQNNDLIDLKFAPTYIEETFRLYGNHIPISEVNKFKNNSNNKWHYLSSDYGHENAEYMNESFKNGDNKLNNLGVGKSKLIKDWLEKYGIINYTINKDYTIDVKGDVMLVNIDIAVLPDFIQFNKIRGSFSVSLNDFTSLRGCPYEVDFNFWCNYNHLKSLEFAPKKVGANFGINNGLIKSLKYCPEYVGADFYCKNNLIENSEINLKYLGGRIYMQSDFLSIKDEMLLEHNPVLESKIIWG